jgi:hypothetical protein
MAENVSILIASVVVLIALGALYRSARNALSVCVIEVDRGRAKLTRGGIAPRILADIADVVRRPAIARATIRVVRSGGHAEVRITGDVPPAQKQQLRNVVGSVPLAKLINARRSRR